MGFAAIIAIIGTFVTIGGLLVALLPYAIIASAIPTKKDKK